MRLVLTGGVSPDGMHFDPETPTFFIVTHELFDVPASVYVDGAKLLAVEHRRELPEAKTTGYLTWLRHHPRLDAEGAMDLLYHSDGVVSEAATASFYVVRDGRILAPQGGVLWGTVGSWVLELACRRVRDRLRRRHPCRDARRRRVLPHLERPRGGADRADRRAPHRRRQGRPGGRPAHRVVRRRHSRLDSPSNRSGLGGRSERVRGRRFG